METQKKPKKTLVERIAALEDKISKDKDRLRELKKKQTKELEAKKAKKFQNIVETIDLDGVSAEDIAKVLKDLAEKKAAVWVSIPEPDEGDSPD